MTEEDGIIERKINWQVFWEDLMWLSKEKESEFREAFQINRCSLRIPFGPVDGSGNWANE